MLYKIKNANFHLINMLEMLKGCNGILKCIRTNKKINKRFKHNTNFKIIKRKGGYNFEDNLQYLILKYKLFYLNKERVDYIMVEAENINKENWIRFGYDLKFIKK